MIDELEQAMQTYLQQWQQFVDARSDKDFFAKLKPISVGWKVADVAEYNKVIPELQEVSNRITGSWLDERWLGGFHTKEAFLPGDVRHIKLMQRRPAKPNDNLGLDHIDFLLPADTDIEALLANEDVEWEREKGDLCEWISIRFNNAEAKLRWPELTSFDAVIKEWQTIKQEITGA